MLWAEHSFRLDKRDKNGNSLRDHLLQVERQIGFAPEELKEPCEFPSLLRNIWSAFIRLHNARTYGMNGPNPITYTELQAWKELSETPFSPREIEAVRRLDTAYLRVTNERS